MKAVLLLLTSFFISILPTAADTLVMRDGRVVHGRVEGFSEQKLKFVDKSDNKPNEFPLQQVQSLYFSMVASDGKAGVDDQFCIDQLKKIGKDNTYGDRSMALRRIRSVELSSAYTWTEEVVATYYCHGLLPESITTYTIDYHSDYDQVEVVDASFITPQQKVVRLPDASFKKYSPYSFLPHLSKLMRLEVKLPETVKGTLVNLRIRKKRLKKMPFSNFYLDYSFSSDLPVTRSELRVTYPADAEWTVNNKYNTVSEQVRYLRSTEENKVVKSWWMEDVIPVKKHVAMISVTAQDASVPEAIGLYSEAVGNELLKLGNSKLIKRRSAEERTLDKILNEFSRNFTVLPSNGIPFATDPITAWHLNCGTADTLAVLLLHELGINGFKADMLLCREEKESDDKLFSFTQFAYPVIRIRGEETVYVTPDALRYDMPIPVHGFCVYGAGLREKVTVSEVKAMVRLYKIKLQVNELEVKEGGSLRIEAEFPLFPNHNDAHGKRLVKAFAKLCSNVKGVEVLLNEEKRTLHVQAVFEQQVSLMDGINLLLFHLPEVNDVVDAYSGCNVEVEMDFDLPEDYQVNVLPVDLKDPVRRRFFPTSKGFKTLIEGNITAEKLSEMIIMKHKNSRHEQFWYEGGY